MTKTEFKRRIAAICTKKGLDVKKAAALPDGEKLDLVAYIVRNRAPIVVELIPTTDTVPWSEDGLRAWLYSCSYQHTTKGKASGYTFLHTGGARDQMTANEKRFREVYAVKLAEAIAKHPDDYFYGPDRVPGVVDKMTESFKKGEANFEGAAKAAARACGVRLTAKALREFLNAGDEPIGTNGRALDSIHDFVSPDYDGEEFRR